MKFKFSKKLFYLFIGVFLVAAYFIGSTRDASAEDPMSSTYKKPKTHISIVEGDFYVNGSPTFQGREWKGHKIEGLLPNSRMVNGIFDDLNPESVDMWKYPDTQKWDADRNTREFLENMPIWKSYGLISFNINLQGGSPQGYSKSQPWINSAFDRNGELRPAFMKRLKLILDKADELEMVPNLGIFYFGQDEKLKDEKAVINAVDNTMDWLFENNYKNILIEVANECNNKSYDHAIIKADRIHELIDRIKVKEKNGFRFLVSVSYNGGDLPSPKVVQKSDYILLHGNGVSDPNKIVEMVKSVKEIEGYTEKPIVFNEDDHFDFDKNLNNFVAATSQHASWGFFDYRKEGEPFKEGYQSVPVDWSVNSERKMGFFNLLKEMTGVNNDN